MIRTLATVFAAVLGLAFGSFLNVCLSRWPAGESIVHPRSHCRNCTHTLSWWENIPLLSWLLLRGRCRTCRTAISWRYPLVEVAVGALWAWQAWQFLPWVFNVGTPSIFVAIHLVSTIVQMIFYWLLVALAMLDAENLWLPDSLTLIGAALGLADTLLLAFLRSHVPNNDTVETGLLGQALSAALAILAAASLILLIRWLYKLIRHQEGIGLGDAKLMALLAAWLGLPGALLAFALGSILGALAALVLLAAPSARTNPKCWATSKLPLGTFLCIGGIVSSLWGQPMIAAYLRWAGF
jgi:leader peptidase (prepilin peptidase)/N-methyltransferase